MKISMSNKIRWFMILLLFYTLIQGGIILQIIHGSVIPLELKQNIQNTIYIISFIEFITVLIFFFYIPRFIKKSFAIISTLIQTIKQGDYKVYSKEVPETNVLEIKHIINDLTEMLKSIIQFDTLKKEKILEHHNRIKAILRLSKDGFLILDLKGNIVYMNDIVSEIFPSISENSNMLETNFPPEIENNIKKYIINVFKTQTNIKSTQFYVPSLKKHITLESVLIRVSDGKVTGAVIALTNLEKKEK